MDLQQARAMARGAALAGGRVVLEAGAQEGRGVLSIELKDGPGNYVTDVDRAAEEAVRGALAPSGIEVVGEELGGESSDEYWLVDPIDGTVNFLHGLPVVGVSVALVERDRPVAGCVHAPYLGTTWTAARGLGAEQDGRPIAVTSVRPEEAVVGTGFPFRHPERREEYLRAMLPAMERFEDLRRPGAVSLDLAWVASGAYDGFFELGLSPWDVAAGVVLIEEAGGLITDWSGGDDVLSGDVLAGSHGVHAALVEIAAAV